MSIPLEYRAPDRPKHARPTVVELAREQLSPADGMLVPQKTYRPNTQSDRRRYVDEVELEAPIMFHMQNPDRCGMSLVDALHSRFMNLCDRDDHMFEQRGPSVSIRLMVCLGRVVSMRHPQLLLHELTAVLVAGIRSLEQANTDKGLSDATSAYHEVEACKECCQDSQTFHRGM